MVETPSRPKCLLVFPTPIATIPTGLTYVAKRFAANGFDVKTYVNSFGHYRDHQAILDEIVIPFAPAVVGVSYGTFNIPEVYRLQQACRQAGYPVLAGGPHPTILPEEALGHGAQYVIRGEGELAIDDFCRFFFQGERPEDLVGVRSLSYVDGEGRVHHNPKARRIMNTTELGDMDTASFDLDPFRTADGNIKGFNVISAGRGCPFRCGYCSHSHWYALGRRDMDAVIEEMVRKHERYGITNFWMSDETFTVHKDRLLYFCDRLRKERLPFTWMAGTRVDCVDEEMLVAMRDSGMLQITYGVESAAEETLRKINKGYCAKQAYDTVETTGRLGIRMYINLMTGFPWETPEHVNDDIRFIKTVDRWVNCFQLYGAVIPYPDTPIYEDYHEQFGFTQWWLQEKYQQAGMVIYQNVQNPYAVSSYFQRNLYDDTYVARDYFFRFSPEYKRAVRRMGRLIGWKAIQAQNAFLPKQLGLYALGLLSQGCETLFPGLEQATLGKLFRKNTLHERRLTGLFLKK